MKRSIQISILLISVLLSNELYAQNVISPYLDLQGPLYLRENIYSLNKAGNGWIPWAVRNTSLPEITINLANISSVNANGGNLGIGTAIPTAKLDINGKGDNIINSSYKIIDTDLRDMISIHSLTKTSTLNLVSSRTDAGLLGGLLFTTTIGASDSHRNIAGIVGGKVSTDQYAGGYLSFWTKNGAGDIPRENMRISPEGNLLISKTTQVNAAYKLDVAGSVRANEIVVNTTGADFVFENNYKLRPLQEVESFIKTNKHLPEIADASQMQKEGVSVGELQTQLLQKVEELTLYLIELKKENESIKQTNQELLKQNSELSKRVLKLETY